MRSIPSIPSFGRRPFILECITVVFDANRASIVAIQISVLFPKALACKLMYGSLPVVLRLCVSKSEIS